MLSIFVGGVEYSLDDGVYAYYLGDDGLGMAPAHRFSERGPQQHGDSDLGYLLDPRYFRLFLDIEASTFGDLYARRQALMNLFKPTSDPMKLRWNLDTGLVRQIDCYYVSDFNMSSADREAFAQRVAIGLKAPFPAVYDPTMVSVVFNISAAGGGWDVPWVIPWEIGGSTLDQYEVIQYAGSFDSYPVIRIEGPITNPVITNEETGGEKLDFTGVTIGSGNWYEVDCRYGQKTVVDDGGVNKLADLTDDSDLSTFHLVANIDGGSTRANSIRVQGTGANVLTRVYLQYFTNYVGM